jgi:hypothetical protein
MCKHDLIKYISFVKSDSPGLISHQVISGGTYFTETYFGLQMNTTKGTSRQNDEHSL